MGRFGRAVAGAISSISLVAGIAAFQHIESERAHQEALECYEAFDGQEAVDCTASSGYESLALGILSVGGAIGTIAFGRVALRSIEQDFDTSPVQLPQQDRVET